MDLLRVDLTTGVIARAPLDAERARLGGRGLTSAIVATEVDPETDPLGPGNSMVFAGGILAGTSFPNGGRLSVGAKSPLTAGIKEANAGGEAARKLANLGLRAVAVSGASSELNVLVVDLDGGRLLPAPELKGLGCYDTVGALRSTYGDDTTFILCGPAGERHLKGSAVVTTTPDFYLRTASRGGLGAVMGSKNLKAIVISDKGAGRTKVADPGALKQAASTISDAMRGHGVVQGLRALGTPMLMNVASAGIGCLATRNYSVGCFEKAEAISGETLVGLMDARPNASTSHRCMTGCIIHCSQVFTDEAGEFVTSGIEFETLTLLGSNCAIGDIEQLARLDRLCDDLGLDTMEVGAAIGVAMEGGLLEWGDAEAAYALIDGVRSGKEDSLLIANGCVATGKKLGVTRIPAVKGQSISAWEPRVLKATGVTYATSPMGADHTAGNALPSETYDSTVREGQVEMSQFLQSYFGAIDTLGICMFASLVFLDDVTRLFPVLAKATGAVLGEEVPDDFLIKMGEAVIRQERDFNRRAGFTNDDDRLPAFMTTEVIQPRGLVFDIPEAEIDAIFP